MLVMEGSSSTNTIMKDPDVPKTYGSGSTTLEVIISSLEKWQTVWKKIRKLNYEYLLPTIQKYPAIWRTTEMTLCFSSSISLRYRIETGWNVFIIEIDSQSTKKDSTITVGLWSTVWMATYEILIIFIVRRFKKNLCYLWCLPHPSS